MTFITSILLAPLVLLFLCAGFGELALRGAGIRSRPDLLLPVGLAALLAIGYLIAWAGLAYPLNVTLIAGLALAGLVLLALARPTLTRERSGLPILAALISGAFVIAPVVLHGNPTLAGYLLDTTSGIHMAAGDWVLHNGLNFASVGVANAGDAMLTMFYASNPYPAGGQFLLAVLGSLTATSQLWLYTTLMAMFVAIGAIPLFGVARAIGLTTRVSLLAAVIASVPALVYGYALQGSIKEIAFIPLLALLTWLLVDRELAPKPRGLAVIGGLTCGAIFSVIGFSAIAWVGCYMLALVVAQARQAPEGDRLRAFFVGGALLSLGVLIASLPSVLDAQASIKLALGLSQTNASLAADPGNLLQPIGKIQSLGIWLSQSHRSDPGHLLKPTMLLIGIAFGLLLAGGLVLLRSRRWRVLTWLAVTAFLWLALTQRGTMWIDAKLVMLSSAAIVMTVVVGAVTLRQSTIDASGMIAGRSISAMALTVVALGVFASDAQLYLNYGVLPTDRYKELEAINEDFAGRGPAFSPEFDEYAIYVLRDVKVTMPGSAAKAGTTGMYRDGQPVGYGSSIDIDQLPTIDHVRAPLVVQRPGPWRSNPGPWFKLERLGTYSELWKRTGTPIHVISFVPLGNSTAFGRPGCAAAARLKAKTKRSGEALIAGVPRGTVQELDLGSLRFNGGWSGTQNVQAGQLELHPAPQGGIDLDVTVARGQWLWWRGRIDRDIKVQIDGREVGVFKRMVGGPGNVLAPVRLPAGHHTVTLVRGGGRLAPGSRNGSTIEALALAPRSPSVARDVSAMSAAQLCTRQFDWLATVNR